LSFSLVVYTLSLCLLSSFLLSFHPYYLPSPTTFFHRSHSQVRINENFRASELERKLTVTRMLQSLSQQEADRKASEVCVFVCVDVDVADAATSAMC
jgi:hypothetical protein